MRIGLPKRLTLGRKWTKSLGWSLAVLALAHPLATVLARWEWRLELIAHFREPALVLSLAGSALMLPNRRSVAIGIGLLALCQAWGLSNCSWPNPVFPDALSSSRLRVLEANVLYDNDNRADLIALVLRERPDVLGLIEVSRSWIDGLEPIRSEYPYRYDYPAEGNGTGLALWLKARPTSVEWISPLTEGGIPALHAVLDFAGKRRHLWLIHLVSPFDRPVELQSGREFAVLADRIQRDGGSALAFGDFNSTDGSPHFRRFLERSGLRDSRLGFGRQASWPSWSPYRIAIDHAFLSSDLAVVRRSLGPKIGSDHFPMLFEIAPAASPETKDEAQASQSSTRSGSAEANLTRSATLKNVTSLSTWTWSKRSRSAGSSPISSVVFDPHAGPKAPIKALRMTSDEAIIR
jgi:endonuclease/exonuclease/phosphatase (EEP) superfamily protein YafD